MRVSRLTLWLTVFAAFSLTGIISAIIGCQYFPESFQLAKDSRLPKWITLPG